MTWIFLGCFLGQYRNDPLYHTRLRPSARSSKVARRSEPPGAGLKIDDDQGRPPTIIDPAQRSGDDRASRSQLSSEAPEVGSVTRPRLDHDSTRLNERSTPERQLTDPRRRTGAPRVDYLALLLAAFGRGGFLRRGPLCLRGRGSGRRGRSLRGRGGLAFVAVARALQNVDQLA
jgi:hypothetical protein